MQFFLKENRAKKVGSRNPGWAIQFILRLHVLGNMRLSDVVLRRALMLHCEGRRSQSLEEEEGQDTNKLEPTGLNRVHTDPGILTECQFILLKYTRD